MKLWLLTKCSKNEPLNPWLSIYDCANGFVVRADNEIEARKIAAENCGAEKAEAWLHFARCKELIIDGSPGLILRDFFHG